MLLLQTSFEIGEDFARLKREMPRDPTKQINRYGNGIVTKHIIVKNHRAERKLDKSVSQSLARIQMMWHHMSKQSKQSLLLRF